MWFKKKNKTVPLTQKEAAVLLGRVDILKDWIRQMYSDLYLGFISKDEFDTRKANIDEEIESLIELAKGERNDRNQQVFDDLMGHPMDWLEEIFKKNENGKDNRKGTEKA